MLIANPFRLTAVFCFLAAAVAIGFDILYIVRWRQGQPLSEFPAWHLLATIAAAGPVLIFSGLGMLRCQRWAHWLATISLGAAAAVFLGPWVLPVVAAALWLGQLAEYRSSRSRAVERQVDAVVELLGISWNDFPLARIEAARRKRQWNEALNELRGAVDLEWEAVEDLMAMWPCNALERKLWLLARRLRTEFEQIAGAEERST